MNILMISNDYPPVLGGIATHVKSLSEALAKRGHEVHLLAPTPHIPQNVQTQHTNGVVVHRIGYRHSDMPFIQAFRVARAARQAFAHIKSTLPQHYFDIVHQQDVRATKYPASQIAKQEDIPLVWTYHSPQFWGNRDWKNHLFLSSIRFRPTGIISVSRELYDQASNNWRTGNETPHITFIPNGVDLQLFNSTVTPFNPKPDQLRASDFNVFCPSRFVPKKGIRYLAEAIREILQSERNIPLKAIFFKDSEFTQFEKTYFKEIRQILAPWENTEVFYLDYVAFDNMPGLYAFADLVVIPSLKEAVNLSMLEAMALKKPVLASRVGGLQETITHQETGWLVPPKNPDAVRNALIQLYRDRDLRTTMGEQSYNLVKETFSWSNIAEKTSEFYSRVAHSNSQ